MFTINFRELWAPLSQWLADELDQMAATAQAKWFAQHDADGEHTDVTAASVTVAGEMAAETVTGDRVVAAAGSVSAPSYTFTNATTTGMYLPSAGSINTTLSGVQATTLYLGTLSGHRLELSSNAYGTGGVQGNFLKVGRNSSGSGAAGCLVLTERDGTDRYLWVEGGKLRIGLPPTEDNVASHTGGTVVGTQT